MGGLKCRVTGFLAGAVACLALVLAVPLIAGAAGSFALFGNFVYEDVYGVFDGRALMAKKIGTVTDSIGKEVPLVQQDLVSANGEVLYSTRYARDSATYSVISGSDEVTEYQFRTDKNIVGIGMTAGYIEITNSATNDVGLMSADGKIVLDAEYDDIVFNGDESRIAASKFDGSLSEVVILEVSTLKTLFTLQYPDSEYAVASFVERDGGEVLRVYVSDKTTHENEGHLYAIAGDGTYEELPQEVDVAYGTSSTGEEFLAYVDSSGNLTIECGGEKRVQEGPFRSCSIVGDFVRAYVDGAETVYFSWQGERTSVFDGYRVNGVFSGGSGYFCSGAGTGTKVILGSDGSTICSLPSNLLFNESVVANHVYGWTDSKLIVFNQSGTEACSFDFGGKLPGSISYAWIDPWDGGYVLSASCYDDGDTTTYSVYTDDEFKPIRQGEGLAVYPAAGDATLVDGTRLYVMYEGETSESGGYASVVDVSLTPVSIGGYQLALPLVVDATSDGPYVYNSICRVGTDWYYARDPETGKFGAVDADGEVAIPFEYDSIVDCGGEDNGTMILVRRGEAWSFLDTNQSADPDPSATFSDVTADTPHVEDILWLERNGIAKGWEEDDGSVTFRGMSEVVRQDMAAFLHRLAEHEGVSLVQSSGLSFSDVGADTPHLGDILWLASTGVSEGWDVGGGVREFRGMDTVKRQDMAAFLYRLAGSPDYEPTAEDMAYFSDVDGDTPHFREVLWLASTGVSEGWDVGGGVREFRGMDTVKRQDMAAFLRRMAERVL